MQHEGPDELYVIALAELFPYILVHLWYVHGQLAVFRKRALKFHTHIREVCRCRCRIELLYCICVHTIACKTAEQNRGGLVPGLTAQI